jgi:hypothetical protein
MEQLLAYIAQYGLTVATIAFIVICFIGTLKLCKVFNKISSKQLKKTIYYVLSISLSFGVSALYFVIFNLSWDTYVKFSIAQANATAILYAIYENLGLRKLLQVIATKWIDYIKKSPERKTAKALKNLGLTEDMLNKLQAIAGTTTNDTNNTVLNSNTITSTNVYTRTSR